VCTTSPSTKDLNTEWKVVVKVEYFLILADSTEFARLLAPLEEVDALDGATVSEQVKSQSSGKFCLQESKICHPASYHHHDMHPQASKQQRHQSTMNSFIDSSVLWNMAATTPARQTMNTKNINISTTNSCMFNNNGNTRM